MHEERDFEGNTSSDRKPVLFFQRWIDMISWLKAFALDAEQMIEVVELMREDRIVQSCSSRGEI